MSKLQTSFETLQTGKYLIISLVSSAFVMMLANHFGEDITKIVTNWIFVPVPAVLVVLSILFVIRNGRQGSHGKAWILFAASAVSWFVAEQVWLVYDLIYNVDPFPSPADFFYLVGYASYFAFSIFYLWPVKDAVSKKMIIVALVVSVALIIPTMYFAIDTNSELSQYEIALAASYPVADAITLIPAILGIALFFGGKVNFMWSLMLIGILCDVAGDTGFLVASLDDSYYTGHPIDILFLWAYILFIFGVHDHMKLFKKRSKENRFNDQASLR